MDKKSGEVSRDAMNKPSGKVFCVAAGKTSGKVCGGAAGKAKFAAMLRAILQRRCGQEVRRSVRRCSQKVYGSALSSRYATQIIALGSQTLPTLRGSTAPA